MADVLIAECYERLSPGRHQPKKDKSAHARSWQSPKGAMARRLKRPAHRWKAGATALLAATGGQATRIVSELVPGLVRYPPIYARPAVRWPQESLERAFSQLFPPGVFEGFRFPFVEDIVNAAPFTSYVEWREEMGLEVGGSHPPLILAKRDMRIARVETGVQQGAFAQRAALPPVVSFGLSSDEHFQAALHAASQPSPWTGGAACARG